VKRSSRRFARPSRAVASSRTAASFETTSISVSTSSSPGRWKTPRSLTVGSSSVAADRREADGARGTRSPAYPAVPSGREHADDVDIAHDAENARAWLRARGFDVRVEKRSLREDFVRRGLRGVDTIDLAYWADLVGIANPA